MHIHHIGVQTPVIGNRAVADGGHGRATVGDPAMKLVQGLAGQATKRHILKGTRFDKPVFQSQAIDMALAEELRLRRGCHRCAFFIRYWQSVQRAIA